MSELVGRFLSFEEDLGDGLVKFAYYVLLFLLIVSSLYEWVTAFFHIFMGKPWSSLGLFLFGVPLRFLVGLLLLRIGAEVILAVLSIDDSLQKAEPGGDTMSSGLSLGAVSAPPSGGPEPEEADDDAEPAPRPKSKKAAKKTAKKAVRKAAKKAAKKTAAAPAEPAAPQASEKASEETASPEAVPVVSPANTNEAASSVAPPKGDEKD